MPSAVPRSKQERSSAGRLLRLLLVVATLGALAIPVCTDNAFGGEMMSMSDRSIHAAASVPAPAATSGEHHCAGHDCAAPRTSPHAETPTGSPVPDGSVLMNCLLLLMAVLAAPRPDPVPPRAEGPTMNLTAVLLTGLLAGGVSCAAVQGGLLAGLITRQRAAVTSPERRLVPAEADRTPAQRLGDDIAPVGGFLAGKLLSHVLLGALLGALGSVVQLSLGTRTALQLSAGALIIVLGLAQLGVPGLRGLVVEPPALLQRLVRRRARSQSALAPALLGVTSVLIPCGVTLSVQALALASGSALQGATIMGVFVLGTSPLFALFGYAARRAATVWRGRLALVTGVVVVVMGLYTLNGGLELAGSPAAASRVYAALSAPTPSEPQLSAVTEQVGRQEIVITANTGSYSPDAIQARAGLPTTLIVRSDNARGCVRSFLIPDRNVDAVLPVNGDTQIDLGVLAPGQLRYSCGMGMYTGSITAS